jgi:hypothetical protein
MNFWHQMRRAAPQSQPSNEPLSERGSERGTFSTGGGGGGCLFRGCWGLSEQLAFQQLQFPQTESAHDNEGEALFQGLLCSVQSKAGMCYTHKGPRPRR